jgi:hypothetical protein
VLADEVLLDQEPASGSHAREVEIDGAPLRLGLALA